MLSDDYDDDGFFEVEKRRRLKKTTKDYREATKTINK